MNYHSLSSKGGQTCFWGIFRIIATVLFLRASCLPVLFLRFFQLCLNQQPFELTLKSTLPVKWAGIIPQPQCTILFGQLPRRYLKHNIHQLWNKIFVENLLRSSPKVASSHSHSQFTCKPSIVISFSGHFRRLMILIKDQHHLHHHHQLTSLNLPTHWLAVMCWHWQPHLQ